MMRTAIEPAVTAVSHQNAVLRQAAEDASTVVSGDGTAMARRGHMSTEDVVNLSHRLESGDAVEERRKRSVAVTADERRALLEKSPRGGKISVYG